MTEEPESSSKEHYLKVDFLVPDDCRLSTVRRGLELLHRDAKLRILQPENGQECYYDE